MLLPAGSEERFRVQPMGFTGSLMIALRAFANLFSPSMLRFFGRCNNPSAVGKFTTRKEYPVKTVNLSLTLREIRYLIAGYIALRAFANRDGDTVKAAEAEAQIRHYYAIEGSLAEAPFNLPAELCSDQSWP